MESVIDIDEEEKSNPPHKQQDSNALQRQRKLQQQQLQLQLLQEQQHRQQQQRQQQSSTDQQLKALLSAPKKTGGKGGRQKHANGGVTGTTSQVDDSVCLEELAQLICDSISTDMNTPPAFQAPTTNVSNSGCSALNSVGKCSSVVQEIKQESQSPNAVQQSHVSSSKPSFVPNDLLGSILLKALNGFLFVVDCQGKVEFVSENVSQFLNYTQDDLVGRSVYNIIHVGDHPQFSNSLLPMTLASGIAWPSDSPTTRGCSFHCRMLTKPPSEEEEDVELKQTHVSQYENMQITAFFQSSLAQKLTDSQLYSPQSKDNPTSLLCIACRVPLSEKNNMPVGGTTQFSTKQDLLGKIIRAEPSQVMGRMEGSSLIDFCHADDVQQMKKHSQDVLKSGLSTSGIYRFRLAGNRYFFVQTKSKLFNSPVTGAPEFILSTHSVIRKCDSDVEHKSSNSALMMSSITGQSGRHSSSSSSGAMLMEPVGPVQYQPTNTAMTVGAQLMEPSSSDLDLLGDLSIFSELENMNMRPMASDATSSQGSRDWGSLPTLKSPAPTSASPSPIQFALQNRIGSPAMRPPDLNLAQRSGLLTSFDGSQKSPRLTPSPGNSTRGTGVSQGYPSQRSPAATVGKASVQQNLRQGQFILGFQQKAPASPQPGFPSSPSGWKRSPAVCIPGTDSSTSTKPSSDMPLSSPLNVFKQFDPTPRPSAMTGLDIVVNSSSPSSVFPVSSPSLMSYHPASSQQQTNASFAGNKNNNSGMTSQRLCQLLTQNTMAESLQASVSLDGRRQIIGRIRQSSGQIGSTVSTPNPAASNSNSGSMVMARGIGNLGVTVHLPGNANRTISSPDDLLHQSPTEGPGQSPQEKPQSTSNEDSEIMITNAITIGSASNNYGSSIRSHRGSLSSLPTSDNNGNNNNGRNNGGRGQKNNCILKSLLRQEEEDEEPALLDQGSSLPAVISDRRQSNSDFLAVGERNEAVPWKNNALLKKLLGGQPDRSQHRELNEKIRREIAGHVARSSSTSTSTSTAAATTAPGSATSKRKHSTGRELLLELLDKSDDEDGDSAQSSTTTTSAPAESTSAELDQGQATRSRHQSEYEEPQSTSFLTPSPNLSLTSTSSMTPSSILSLTSASSMTLSTASLVEQATPQGFTTQKTVSSINGNLRRKQFEGLLHSLSAEEDSLSKLKQNLGSVNSSCSNDLSKRRKMSAPDVDSSDGVSTDMEPSTSSIGPNAVEAIKPSQKNALLAQLLSKKANKGASVNSLAKINPTAVPQNRYPRNLSNRFIKIKPANGAVVLVNGNATIAKPGESQTATFVGNVIQTSTAPMDISTGLSGNISLSRIGTDSSNFLTGGYSNNPSPMDADSGISGMDFLSIDSQLSQFQTLLDSGDAFFSSDSSLRESMSGRGRSEFSDNDPLLQQILQQVQDLQEDLQKNKADISGMGQSLHSNAPLNRMGAVGGIGAGLSVNSDTSSSSFNGQGLSTDIQLPMQGRLNLIQQQQQQKVRINILSSQKHVQQRQQQLQQKQLGDELLSYQQQQQTYESFLSPPQQPSSATTISSSSASPHSFFVGTQSSFSSTPSPQQNTQSAQADAALDDEANLFAQLEEIFKGDWPRVDSYGSEGSHFRQDQSNKQSVIDGIKRELMGADYDVKPPQQVIIVDDTDNRAITNRQNAQHFLHNQMMGSLTPKKEQYSQLSTGPVQSTDVCSTGMQIGMLSTSSAQRMDMCSPGTQIGMLSTGSVQSMDAQQRSLALSLNICSPSAQILQLSPSPAQGMDICSPDVPRSGQTINISSPVAPRASHILSGPAQRLDITVPNVQLGQLSSSPSMDVSSPAGQLLQMSSSPAQNMDICSPGAQMVQLTTPARNMDMAGTGSKIIGQSVQGTFNQVVLGLPSQQQQQQSRFTAPRGPHVTVSQSGAPQQLPAGLNTPAMMVRQTLLHRQIDRQKQDRERQQRLSQQQQQQHQGLLQSSKQRLIQAGLQTIDTTAVVSQAPPLENLRELMTQDLPPNVTLIAQGNQQRPIPGGSLPSPGRQKPQQKQFQFAGGGGLTVGAAAASLNAGLFSRSQQQQQQKEGQAIFQQSRMMQSVPSNHEPSKLQQAQFSNISADPLLISPQAATSSKATLRQTQQPNVQQAGQKYNQVSIASYGGQAVSTPGGLVSYHGGSPLQAGVTSFSSGGTMSQSTASAMNEFELQILDAAISSMESKSMSTEAGPSSGTSSTSQYVKQELRNICSARSEKQQQQQQQMQPQQQQQLQQSMDFDSSCSELPPDILETISDMSRELGGPLGSMHHEVEAVTQVRSEAKQRYKQFQKLSATGQVVSSVADPSEQAEVTASSLFRNQLLTPSTSLPASPSTSIRLMVQTSKMNSDVSKVNIIQSESRTPVEDICPVDNRNSLLCKLLSAE